MIHPQSTEDMQTSNEKIHISWKMIFYEMTNIIFLNVQKL